MMRWQFLRVIRFAESYSIDPATLGGLWRRVTSSSVATSDYFSNCLDLSHAGLRQLHQLLAGMDGQLYGVESEVGAVRDHS